MTARAEFLEAWVAHDRAASAFSARGGWGASTETLKDRTDELSDTRAAYAETLDVSSVHLADVLVAWRRCGFDHAQAVRAFEAGWKERNS